MATSLAAFKGSFGSTNFWVLTMKAGEFVRLMTIPKDLDEWEDLSPEEKFQREINYKRVATHIAPYLAHDEDRFIGAFIVEVRNADEMVFESLTEAGVKGPRALPQSLMNQFGVLYLSGAEVLIPLDGQHRLAALKFAISGVDEKSQSIKGLTPNPKIAEDTCTVILIKHDLEKARKIFNKVNKYAKPTSKADNLITDDTDYIAVISREEIVGEIIPARLVKSGAGNTLSASAIEFTTLSTIYEINVSIERAYTGSKLDLTKTARLEDKNLAVENLTVFWKNFLQIQAYSASLADPSDGGDERRADIRKSSLACKPIVQRVLAEVVLEMQTGHDGSKKFTPREVVAKINQIDWSPTNPIWQGILLNGDKIISGSSPQNFAVRMICFLLGQPLEALELERLRTNFAANVPGRDMPQPIL
ncbi:DNA sulfur modification protein DndB [Shewanella sp.]|uniref:DNA sulfur modification protein DndB n=1 Tax=Shewanella sp. TaxID=50422 RepID=UPI004047147A